MAISPPASSELQSLVGVCHHCGRLLRAGEEQRHPDDEHFSDGAEALHCTACLERHHPAERSVFPWRRLLSGLVRLGLGLALLSGIGLVLAALIQRDDFGLGALWQQLWPALAPWWELVAPVVNPYLRQLQPLVDMVKDVLSQFL